MRVVECNICGEPLSAASDDELADRLRAHVGHEHDDELDDDDAREMIAAEAYEATDS